MRQDRNEERDIREAIENKDIPEYPLECSCNNSIREGNRLYLILSKCSGGWTIEDLVCYRCSVRDSLERIQDGCKKSVVKSTLRRPERVLFSDVKLIELID